MAAAEPAFVHQLLSSIHNEVVKGDRGVTETLKGWLRVGSPDPSSLQQKLEAEIRAIPNLQVACTYLTSLIFDSFC
jgi:hypothetical protein